MSCGMPVVCKMCQDNEWTRVVSWQESGNTVIETRGDINSWGISMKKGDQKKGGKGTVLYSDPPTAILSISSSPLPPRCSDILLADHLTVVGAGGQSNLHPQDGYLYFDVDMP
jgi:hypothetical protein